MSSRKQQKKKKKTKHASSASPSLRSLSPDRPAFSSGNKPKGFEGRPESPTLPSLHSMSPERPDLSSGNPKDRKVIPEKSPVRRTLTRKSEDDSTFRPSMEDWTIEHVKDWLLSKLRIPPNVAQNLYAQGTTGASLVSFDKQDLIELGVPPAQALQIVRQVEKFNRQCELSTQHYEPKLETTTEELLETQTDSGFHSERVSVLQEEKDVIEDYIAESFHKHLQIKPLSQMKQPVCVMRPFDQSNAPVFYTEQHFLPTVAGPSDLLEPVHEYQLLPDSDVSQREALLEFTNEMFCFAASCMNSRTNGTIHFGVKDKPEEEHGQIIGHEISSTSLYGEAFESNVSKYFEQQHINSARMCIRPPVFIQVQHEDGTVSDKFVIEVDVVPSHSETQNSVFYTIFNNSSTAKHHSKTECLFVREGSRKVNILSDSNPRVLQDKMKEINEKVKLWASARKTAEQRYKPHPSYENQGQRLKQLITRGQDALSNSIQVFVVTDKCHSSQLEHMDFLKELNLFAVLDFDPESAMNGTCHFYRRDHVANLHFPHMYSTQDSTSVIAKLNLFKQTSWIFCNGQAGEEGDLERPLTPSEWLKKRSGDINNMVSFLCSPDLLSKHGLLVLIILHSAVTDISSPVLETFCALYRSLEGMDNMLCLCKDATVFRQWKHLVAIRCKEDITNKCIHTLSFQEISSTIKTLKEPQTRALRRFLPSTGSSSVLLEKKDEEMMTDLEILCENECENTEIETNYSFEEFKKNIEEVFYRGGRVSWWNFYLSEQPGNLPFIKRDKYNELHKLISPVQGHASLCVIVSLFHHPGCGGTTLAMHILWSLKNKFRCAVVKNQMATNKEIALQVKNLLTYGKQEQSGYTPVLLLIDNWHDIGDLKQCIIMATTDRNQPNMVVVLNCERTPFPDEASRYSDNPNVFISAKLSPKEKDLFFKKYEELKDSHDKPDTFYAFMIMKNDFSKEYINDLVNNILKDLDIGTQQCRLLSFLALLNTYVHESYMSLSLCEELMEIRRNLLQRQETLEYKMNPYSTLLITFDVEEHGTYQAVRLLHQMIAENCLKVFKEHKVNLSDITIDLLYCEKLYKTCMGKDFLTQFIQSMLVTRTRREQGDDKNTQFSPLIESIKKEEGFDKVKEVLERAIDRFDRSATLPQALARHMCLNEKDFNSALKWALDAQSKRSNSYIADTVGQVYKSHFKKIIEDSKEQTPESLNECLNLAFKAVSAFKQSQELAEKDEQHDPLDLHFKRGHTSYNLSGYLAETEVIMMVLDLITELPVFSASDRHSRDKMVQFLKGQHPISSLFHHSDPRMNAIVTVLKDHERFLLSLKPRLKENFSFFEHYFTYLRPRHVPLKKETTEERNKQKVSELFKKYITLFSRSEQEKLSERARNPKLSLQQVIVDHRCDLEMMQADSFAGLLQSLSHKDPNDIENILNKWKYIFEHSGRYPPIYDIVNYILANIVLHSVQPNSGLLKKYEELMTILSEALQREGTRSSLPELYFLCMLLMWPSKDQTFKQFTEYSNICTYIASAKRSFHKRFSFMFPSRSAIAYFFLGKSSGLKRIVSKAKLDQILQESKSSDQIRNLWHTGVAWSDSKIQEKLLRVKGRSENGDIYVTYGANTKILIRPAYLGDIRSGYSREEVSFYIGFTLEGPVAYGVK